MINANGGAVAAGIDFSTGMTFSSGYWAAMPNATYVGQYNAAGLAITKVIGLDASDTVSIYDGAFKINSSGRAKLTGASGSGEGSFIEMNDGTTSHVFGTTGAVLGNTDRGLIIWNSHATAPTRCYTNGAERMHLGAGLVVGAATGDDKGAGTINVSGGIYKNDSAYANPDYALEHYFTGKISKFAENPGAETYSGLIPLDKLEQYMRENLHLPRVAREPSDVFERCDIALEKIEELTLYIIELQKRLGAMEAKQ